MPRDGRSLSGSAGGDLAEIISYYKTHKLEMPNQALQRSGIAQHLGRCGDARMSAGEPPFNRFSDLTKVGAIDVSFTALVQFATRRRVGLTHPSLKAAVLVTPEYYKSAGSAFEVAWGDKKYQKHFQVFTDIKKAAAWLEVPVKLLRQFGEINGT